VPPLLAIKLLRGCRIGKLEFCILHSAFVGYNIVEAKLFNIPSGKLNVVSWGLIF
jgi:hypothetical protein